MWLCIMVCTEMLRCLGHRQCEVTGDKKHRAWHKQECLRLDRLVHAEGSEAEAACERLVGVDCEMCVTCEGYELTRLTLVDGDGKVCPA